MDNRFKREIWLGVGIILGSIIIFLVSSTLFSDRMAASSQKISSTRMEIAKRTDLIVNLANIKNTSAEAEIYQQKMNSLLPSQEQLLNFPQALGALATAHGVTFSFSFRGTLTLPTALTPGVAGFSMDTNGTLDQLKIFLNDIEAKASRFMLSVDTFDLSQTATAYSMSIQGRSFFQ
jgi:Tfp pilus assembly protein PilO